MGPFTLRNIPQEGNPCQRFYSRWRKQRFGTGLQRLRRELGYCYNLKDVKCETVGTEIQGGTLVSQDFPGGARFQFEDGGDLEEVEDLGVLWIELSPQILVLKSRPAVHSCDLSGKSHSDVIN